MVASTGLLVSTTRRCLHTASHNLASGPHPAFRPINTISTARISQHGRLRPVYRSFPKTSSVSRSPVASLQARQYSSDNKAGSSWEVEPVELKYDLTEPPSTSTSTSTSGQSLVICHGLFGSKQNWRSLANAFAQKLGMPVYTLDLRNHGASPHAVPHTYAAMATDIAHFMQQQGLNEGVNLMGHSMGGKAVMAYALNSELNKPLRSLVVVDMSPAQGKISPEFAAYNEAMKDVERAKVKTKAEADKILQKVEPILATRQFLLTNTKTGPDGYLTFRVPIDLLSRAIPSIGDFPFTPPSSDSPSAPSSGSSSSSPPSSSSSESAGGRTRQSGSTPTSPTWSGPTLFLKGEHSKYLNRHNIPVAQRYFPNMRLEVLDAGHWVHAEQPAETVRLVDEFIRGVKG